MFSSRFMLFPFLKNIWCQNKFREGVSIFFFRKTLLYHFISRFMLFSTLKKSISNIILYSLVLIFYLKHVKFGGGGNIFLAFYAISNISRKNKFWE